MSIYSDGNYSHGATFQNANDRVMWEQTFAVGTEGQKKMAAAMIASSPATTAEEIRFAMTAPLRTPQRGVKVEPDLGTVLNVGASGPISGHMNDSAPTDFSGSNGSYSGTSMPGLAG